MIMMTIMRMIRIKKIVKEFEMVMKMKEKKLKQLYLFLLTISMIVVCIKRNVRLKL